MAPKKIENKTALGPKVPKETKGRIKKGSPKSKKQILKVKLPIKNRKHNTKKKSIVENASKMLIYDRMNEVARAQLVKDCPVEIESTPEPVARKRGRPMKKQCPEPDPVPKKKPKVSAKNQKKVVQKSKVAPPKQNTTVRKRNGRLLRGKQKTDDDSTITSPSILSQGLPDCKIPVKQAQRPIIVPVVVQNNTDSRRTSFGSEWSWTKDMSMSGSSTTTCVTVNSVSSVDFFRIDGKLPEIKLKKISLPGPTETETQETVCEEKDKEHSLSEDSSSTCSSSSSSSSSSDSTTNQNNLNLSTSSISPISYSPTYTAVNRSFDRTNKPDLNNASSPIEMLAPKLKCFDLSQIPDIGNESDTLNMKPFEKEVFKILEEEYNAMFECNFLNHLLSEKCSITENDAPETESNEDKTIEEPEFAKPEVTVISNKSVCDRDSHNDSSFDIGRRRDAYDPNEDDDVLSLNAESLTGLECSRLSSAPSTICAPHAHEEYVPQPLAARPPMAVYQPTRINDPETTNTKSKPVCEKQNADSTSIHKEQELEAVKVPPVNSVFPEPKQSTSVVKPDRPTLTISYYQTPYRSKSLTLRGVCFFNLTSQCKNKVCRYPHRIIDGAELSRRLCQLSEEHFFQEYMLISKWTVLKRRYVKCFVNECQRRDLPRILVEIVIHFLLNAHPDSAEDTAIKLEIIESALMYLNSWDLAVCEQLLMYKVGGKFLCEVFMEVIGSTQNFSRFKHVFINLARFMVRVNRTFSSDVVAHVLERVCILPYEAALSAVLVSIIERTDSRIFQNNMMDNFVVMLNSCNTSLHARLLGIREKNVTIKEPGPVSEMCPPALPSPCGSKELEPLVIQNGGQDEQSYTSPDTTNMDNVNKPATEPVFIRTINQPVKPPNFSVPPPSLLRGTFSNWNQRGIQLPPRIPKMKPMGPLQRPPFIFQRRYGPDFYGNH